MEGFAAEKLEIRLGEAGHGELPGTESLILQLQLPVGSSSANRELKLKYQALCAWELTMPRFTQPDFEFLSGKTFHAPKPWYYQQVLDGTLK